MRKKIVILRILSIIGVIVYLFIGVDALVVAQRLAIPTDWCPVLFDCTSEEFFEKDLELYDEIGDLRKRVVIDPRGYLVLSLTRKQVTAWREHLMRLEDLEHMPHVEISSDYTTMTVYQNTGEPLPDNIPIDMARIIMKLHLIQGLDKKNAAKEVYVIYREKDEKTGEILDEVVLRW